MCSDENGDYPAGSFLLNPAGFRHAPFSRDGCVLFVKLCQFPGEGRDHVVVDTKAAEWRAVAPRVALLPLYRDEAWPEDIAMLPLAYACLLPAEFLHPQVPIQGLQVFFRFWHFVGGRTHHQIDDFFPRGPP